MPKSKLLGFFAVIRRLVQRPSDEKKNTRKLSRIPIKLRAKCEAMDYRVDLVRADQRGPDRKNEAIAVADGGEIVQIDYSSEQKPLEDFDATSNRAYQIDILVSNSEGKSTREASRRRCMPESVLSLVDSTTRISSTDFKAPNSSAHLERADQSGLIVFNSETAESARASSWPIGLPDERHIVVLQSTKNAAHAARVDQCSPTVSLPDNKMVRKCRTMSVMEIHHPHFGSRCEGSAKNFRATRIGGKHVTNRVSTEKRIHRIHQWPFCQCAKAGESGPTVSNSEKGSLREALKRDSLRDLRQHFVTRHKDAAKALCDSLALKSFEVLDSLSLGKHSNNIRHLAWRRTLTHKHCERLKKSQDLPRSLLSDCSGKLAAQSAIGLPDGGYMLSLSKKKILRKTFKRKCRNMSVLSLEYHWNVDSKWEDSVKSIGAKHIYRQLVIHFVSRVKRIRRQHEFHRWPFQQNRATRKGYSALPSSGGAEIVGPTALSASEFPATNRTHRVGQDQSGPTASHSKKKRTREGDHEEINTSITLNDLEQHYGRKRKDAAESLGVSISTLKRICRQHGIERWPNRIEKQVWRPPDPYGETNPSTTCETLSTNGQLETENGPAPSQAMPTIPQTMGISQEGPFLEGLLGSLQEELFLGEDLFGFIDRPVASSYDPAPAPVTSQQEPFLQGDVSGSINWTISSGPYPASSQPMSTIPYTVPTIPLAMPPKLKAMYRDKIIKFQLPLPSGISELKEEVSKTLELELGSFDVEYEDEDGDWILMARDENLTEYLQLVSSLGSRVKKLKISDKVPIPRETQG